MAELDISSEIKRNTFSQFSHVFRSKTFTNGPLGLCKILLQLLCFQFTSLVKVPTPADIKEIVVLFDTTISSAAESAATSSLTR